MGSDLSLGSNDDKLLERDKQLRGFNDIFKVIDHKAVIDVMTEERRQLEGSP